MRFGQLSRQSRPRESPAQSRSTSTLSRLASDLTLNSWDLRKQMSIRAGSHSTFLGLSRMEQGSALNLKSLLALKLLTHLPAWKEEGKKTKQKTPQPCPPLEKKKKNSRKQNTTTSFYFVFFGNYTKDEKLIINISQSPPANSNYNRLNNKW